MKYLHAYMTLVLVTAIEKSAANEIAATQPSANETSTSISNDSTQPSDYVYELREKFQSTLKRSGTTSSAPAVSTIIRKQKVTENGETRTVTEKEIVEYYGESISEHECVCECDCSKECQNSEATIVTKLKTDIEKSQTVTENINNRDHSVYRDIDNNHHSSNFESCANIMSLKKDAKNGVYTINVHRVGQIQVYCYKDPMGTGCGWTLFMRRKKTGDVFDKNWQDYQKGFGELKSSFFLGLDVIHALTHAGPPQELGIFTYFESNHMEPEKYAEFRIGDESTNYMVEVLGKYSKTSLIRRLLLNSEFSTKDRDNGVRLDRCADYLDMGWWYTGNCKAAIKLSGVRAYLNAPVAMGLRPRNCRV